MQTLIRCATFAAALTTSLLAADPSYAGKWKLNPGKSDFGQTTVTYEQMPGGDWKFTGEGVSYTFKTDGKEYPTPWGTTSAWKAVDANTWEMTGKSNGKLIETDTMKLSADGKTLTVNSKIMKADGGSSNDTSVLERVSGGPGMAGKWKTKNVKISAPGVVDIAAKPDGVTLRYIDEGGTCDAKFDGKDHPATGSMWPAGWTCSVSKSGANGLDATWKKDGKVMFKSAFTASSDGKTLTEVGTNPNTTEKTKLLYDRQ